MKKRQKHYHPVLGIVVLLVIAGFVAWYVRHQSQKVAVSDVTTSPSQTQSTIPDSQKPTTSKSRLVVGDQRAGSSIDIDELRLEKPGFVVIQASENGAPGKVVAKSGLLSAGTKQDLIIRFAAVPGTYYASIRTDNGNGVFDAITDSLTNDSYGHPLSVKFMVVK